MNDGRPAETPIPAGLETLPEIVLENLRDGVYLVDRDRRITYWNRGAEDLTGYSREEVLGRHCFENILRHVDHQGNSLCFGICPLARTMEEGAAGTAEVYLHHKNGHRVPVHVRVAPLRDRSGEVVGAVEIFSEDTMKEQLRERVRELERMAMIDSMTGIPNRRFLEAQLEARMSELSRYGWPFGVLFLDVDHFKEINDAHGHEVGDRVLRMIAHTLHAGSRVYDNVGRWGGEEFLALITNVDQDGLSEIGNRFRTLVAASQLPEPQGIRVTVSVGATLARPDDSPESILERADKCLYQAKTRGRNQLCLGRA